MSRYWSAQYSGICPTIASPCFRQQRLHQLVPSLQIPFRQQYAPLIRSLLSKAPSLLRSKTPSCKQLLPPVKGQNANPKPPDEAEQALLVVGSTEFTNPIPPLIWKFRIARSPDDPAISPAAAAFRSLYHPKTEGVLIHHPTQEVHRLI